MTAIEEMAGMDVLCSDKTGTLTLNKLSVDKNIIEVCQRFLHHFFFPASSSSFYFILCKLDFGSHFFSMVLFPQVFAKRVDADAVVLMAARASRIENQDAIDAAIVGMLADPKEV